VVSFTPRPLYLQGKSHQYPLDRKLGGPQSRSGRGGEEKNSQPCRESNPRTPMRMMMMIIIIIPLLSAKMLINVVILNLLTNVLRDLIFEL
jgi:hypothetical protein